MVVDEGRSVIQTHENDSCCGKAIGKAIAAGALDGLKTWECGKCGMEWTPDEFEVTLNGETIRGRKWRPRPVLLVLR